jgi:hypothetical protein
MKRYWLTIAFSGVVAACSATILQDNQWRSGVPGSFQHAAIGPVPTVISGNPFAAPDPIIAQVIADVSAGTYGGAPATFAPSSATTGPRIVWDLSPGDAQTGHALCAKPLRPAATMPPPATNRVMGAFCSDVTVLADVTIRLAEAPSGPDDPVWLQAFPTGLRAMIPWLDPFEDLD